MAFCQKCGNPLGDGDTFCSACGAPVTPPVQAASPEGQQPEPAAQNQTTQESSSEQPTSGAAQQQGPQAGPGPQQGFQYGPQQGFQQNYSYQAGSQQTYQVPPQPIRPSNDHTADFTSEDISKNKVIAMAAYLLGTMGIIISLLAAPESPYASFHSRQALKLSIVNMLLGIITLVLCWTIIVPIAGAVCMIIVFVVRIICFFQVSSGKAKDAPIIGSLPFLK